MKKSIRIIVNIALSALLIFGLSKLALSIRDNVHSRQEYDEAVQIAFAQSYEETVSEAESELPHDPVIAELLAIDFDALRKENEDVIGWIYIPDSEIKYPLLQGSDNAFYLSHTWKKSVNPSGAIFMDCQNRADFEQFNTIIYGHNQMYGDMFASLHDYRKAEYAAEHPYVYIANDEAVFRYDVFVARFVAINSIVYGLNIQKSQHKEEFLSFLQDAYVKTEDKPTIDDSFITLSTCTGGDSGRRMVVVAALNLVFHK